MRVMLGKKSKNADECYKNKWIGAGYDFDKSLENDLPENWREFNKRNIPYYLTKHPEKSKIAAGLACGVLHTISKGIKIDDILLCPDGKGNYYTGKVVSDYYFVKNDQYPHRRRVEWFNKVIPRSEMSEGLRNTTGSLSTAANITKHAIEIETFISGEKIQNLFSTDETIEDVSTFALEKHLEEFLIQNWSSTILSENYDIFEEDGELIGQQYETETGPIDILAISKDKKEFLVVELKKGRASDAVVGQILRYMGYISSDLLEEGQKVKGCIIALSDDLKIKNALKMVSNIDFYKYEVKFQLIKDT